MDKKEQGYEDVKKVLNDEEISESFVFRGELSGEEKEEAEKELLELRMKTLKEMSDRQTLKAELMRMRLLMRDYFSQPHYLQEFSFAAQLKYYAGLLKKPMSDFALDIGVHKTKISRIVNGRENPNIDLMYRLEKHSGGMIPATYWFKLHARKIEDTIRMDKEKRQQASLKVRNGLDFGNAS